MFWESRSFTSGPLYTNCAHSGGSFALVGLFLKLPPHRACSVAQSSSPVGADTSIILASLSLGKVIASTPKDSSSICLLLCIFI